MRRILIVTTLLIATGFATLACFADEQPQPQPYWHPDRPENPQVIVVTRPSRTIITRKTIVVHKTVIVHRHQVHRSRRCKFLFFGCH